jgi:transcription antitermination factor NusG
MSDHQRKWYAVYTKPRWEKKIARKLEDRGIETYCPLNKVTRQWSDRKKIVLDPLFKGYVFIRIEEESKWSVKSVDGVLNYVYWNGKPAVIREEEIDTIRKFLNEFSDVQVEEYKLEPNKKVRVKQGVLMNHEGILLELHGNRAKVRIESMGLQLSAMFEKNNLEPAD